MQFIRNLKIATKMVLFTVIMILFLIAIGVTGRYYMASMYDHSKEMYQDRLLAIEYLNSIDKNLSENEAFFLQMILADKQAEKQESLTKINEMDKLGKQMYDKYVATKLNPFEEERIGKLKVILDDYYTQKQIVVNQAMLDQQGASYRTYMGQVYKVQEEAVVFLEELIKYNQQVAQDLNEASGQEFASASFIINVLTIAAVVLSSLIGIFITRMIRKPVADMQQLMAQAKNGDLTVVGIYQAKDEIGSLTRDFSEMIVGLRLIVQTVQENALNLSSGAQELAANAEQTTQTTNQIASAIQEVASGAETQVRGAGEVSESMKEMSRGIERIADSSQVVSESSMQAAKEAEQGNKVIRRVIDQMNSIRATVGQSADVVQELGEQSKEIGDIVGAITQIANQTNLLALNAAIEAARAGEQGRGFAVVADEVRKLAEQSRESAEMIASLIHRIQTDTKRAVITMEKGSHEVESGIVVAQEAGETFGRILSAVDMVADQIQDVSSSSEQMSAGSRLVTNSVGNMANIANSSSGQFQKVASSSQEQLASMEEISTSVHSFKQMANDLEAIVRRFKIS